VTPGGREDVAVGTRRDAKTAGGASPTTVSGSKATRGGPMEVVMLLRMTGGFTARPLTVL